MFATERPRDGLAACPSRNVPVSRRPVGTDLKQRPKQSEPRLHIHNTRSDDRQKLSHIKDGLLGNEGPGSDDIGVGFE